MKKQTKCRLRGLIRVTVEALIFGAVVVVAGVAASLLTVVVAEPFNGALWALWEAVMGL